MGNDADEQEMPKVSLPRRDFVSSDFTSPSERLDLLTEVERHNIEEWDDLPEKIYSIFFVSNVFSTSFLFAAAVFIFQIIMTGLVLADLINRIGTNNPLNVPPGVTSIVRIAQGLSLALAVILQEDVKQSVQTLHSGYDMSVLKLSTSATLEKWLFAYVMQFCLGAVLLLAIFAQIVKTSSVIEIFLNFAALEFISLTADVAFYLAKHGYVTRQVKDVCDTIQEYKTPPESKNFLARRIVLLIVILGMLGGWIDIIVKQINGEYLCKSLLVQFGDGFIGYLPTFSGAYDFRSNKLLDGRAMYISRGFDEDRLSVFRYCRRNRTWIFAAVSDINGNEVEIDDLCENWILRTRETETFDVSSIPVASWMVQPPDGSGLTFPVDHLFLECNDCGQSTCQGTCMDNVCVCPPERFGDRCEFESPCPKLVIDNRTRPFEAITTTSLLLSQGLPTEYQILRSNDSTPVRFYSRPVYIGGPDLTGAYEAIFFDGRRWLFDSNFAATSIDDLADLFTNKITHLFFDVVVKRNFPLFVSAPLDLGTASNAISPAGLVWFARGTNGQGFDVGAQIESRFVCAFCDEKNVCLNNGECVEGIGKCQCSSSITGAFGALCENRLTCVDLGCQNGGICNDRTGLCGCVFPFLGTLCQFQFCPQSRIFCLNNGICNGNITSCICPLNFEGNFCDSFNCTISGCQNGGVCTGNGFQCDCSAATGFGGNSCEIPNCDDSLGGCPDGRVCDRESGQCREQCCEDSECDPIDCDMESGRCTCRRNNSPCNVCEVPFCQVAGCENGGSCNTTLGACDCPPPFVGTTCAHKCCEPGCETACSPFNMTVSTFSNNNGTDCARCL